MREPRHLRSSIVLILILNCTLCVILQKPVLSTPFSRTRRLEIVVRVVEVLVSLVDELQRASRAEFSVPLNPMSATED